MLVCRNVDWFGFLDCCWTYYLEGGVMEVHEKRKLLEAIDILIKRPAQADETTLGNAIGYFTKLVEDLTQGQITLLPVQKQQLKTAIEEIA